MSSSAKPNDFYQKVFEVVAEIPAGRVPGILEWLREHEWWAMRLII